MKRNMNFEWVPLIRVAAALPFEFVVGSRGQQRCCRELPQLDERTDSLVLEK